MRLVTFELSSPLGPVRRTGALHDDEVFDLCWARAVQHASLGRPRHRQLAEAEVPSDMLELLQGGEYSLEAAREAIDYISLSGDATLDGETWSSGTPANMHFSFPQIIEYITQEADIVPGDLLGSGTIGLGCGFKTDRYLSPGMTVELEAEGIGALRNAVGEKRPRSQIGAPRE
jgi:Fumarylacetoacetate (FAA) hydrolase family